MIDANIQPSTPGVLPGYSVLLGLGYEHAPALTAHTRDAFTDPVIAAVLTTIGLVAWVVGGGAWR